jgi:hypothetical protein
MSLAPFLPGAPRPTLDALVRHADKFGLDNVGQVFKGGRYEHGQVRYSSYKKLRSDSLVEVGRAYLTEENYVALVEALSYGSHREDAREDWNDERREA